MTNNNFIKQEVKALFATPIYFSELERDFSAQELQFIKSKKEDYIVNDGQNKTTKDSNILENVESQQLSKYSMKGNDVTIITNLSNHIPMLTIIDKMKVAKLLNKEI